MRVEHEGGEASSLQVPWPITSHSVPGHLGVRGGGVGHTEGHAAG